jgi:heptosyltransferase-1
MGDVIHTLPAAASLKNSFPGSTLAWVVHPRWAPLLEGNPFVDQVVLLDRRSARSVRHAWRELRAGRFDIAVDFQGLIVSALVASLARPDRIYGFHQAQVREAPAALFYSRKIRATSAHVVDRNLELAAATGASMVLRSFPLPDGAPEGQLPSGGFVLSSPLGGWGGKQWPPAYFSELARKLRRELGLALVLNGPPDAESQLAQVQDAWVHLSGLPGLLDATRRATAIVGIDSGPLHLAAALGKPGVAIFGPTDPARNGPYGDSFTVLRSRRAITSYKRRASDASMEDVTPDDVVEALRFRIGLARQAGLSA